MWEGCESRGTDFDCHCKCMKNWVGKNTVAFCDFFFGISIHGTIYDPRTCIPYNNLIIPIERAILHVMTLTYRQRTPVQKIH